MVIGQGVDIVKNNQVMVTLQMPLAQQSPGESGKNLPFISVSATGSNSTNAARRISLESPRTMLWQHAAVIVYGEEACKKGLSGLLDASARNRNVRKTEHFIVARNSRAADILAVPTPVEDLPALALVSMLEVQDQVLGVYTPILLDEFIRRSADPGIEPAVPGVAIVKPAEGQPYLELSGTGVFKEGRLVGWLNSEESRGFRWIRPKMLTGGIKTIHCPICGQPVVIRTLRSICKISPRVQHGEIVAEIKIKEEGMYYEQRCLHHLLDTEMIPVLDKLAEQLIKKQVTMAVKKAQKLDSDIFGFGSLLRKQQPAAWKRLGGKWSEVFPTVKLDIKVESRIRRTNLRFRIPSLQY